MSFWYRPTVVALVFANVVPLQEDLELMARSAVELVEALLVTAEC